MAQEADSISVIAVTAAVGAVVLLLMLLFGIGRGGSDDQDKKDEKEESAKKTNQGKQNGQQQKKKISARSKRDSKHAFSHSWLAGSLKGHSSSVTGFDFSPNGKYLASVADDRSILLWTIKDFGHKEHKCIRGNVEYDYATGIKFSPDSKAFIVSLANHNAVRIFRIGKKEDGSSLTIQSAFDFDKKHKTDIIYIGIASNGKFIMTCSSDTTLIVWNIKGEVLATIDTYLMTNSFALVSSCGRFVAASGFASDVKVWEVNFDKAGNFKDVARAFELKGHKAGVYSFSFNSDSSRMASVSKDGTWKIWNTFVEYKMQQDAQLLHTGNFDNSGPSLISLSPDSRVVTIATGSSLHVYNAQTTQHTDTIEDIYPGEIKSLVFESSGKFFATSGDKQVHLFHNVEGYRATITDLEGKQKNASTNSMKNRLQLQVQDAQSALNSILEKN